jgi:hypothetical protein
MHHDQDIRNMGGLRKYMPITWITALLGSLALIGTPFFSGFYSQGDGACFIGRIDMAQFLKVHQLEQKYMAATFFAGQGELWATLDQGSSRYYHEQTVSASLVADSYNNYEEDSTRYQVYETMQKVLDDEWKDLEDDVNNICRGYMQDLYRKLRDEHEYLTSDEAVWETIEANELHLKAA